jgi:hypothetical protein
LSAARAYKRSAYADSTKRTYRSQLTCYFKFCIEYKRIPIPVDQCTLVAYVSHLAQKLSPTSIPGYLNVIRLLHVEAGLPNPLCENWEITLLKRGINRLKGKPPQQKLPITVEFLRKIRVLLDMKMPSDVAFWAALLVGFYGFLRKSTLLPSGKLVVGKYLARSDVVDFSLDSFTLLV